MCYAVTWLCRYAYVIVYIIPNYCRLKSWWASDMSKSCQSHHTGFFWKGPPNVLIEWSLTVVSIWVSKDSTVQRKRSNSPDNVAYHRHNWFVCIFRCKTNLSQFVNKAAKQVHPMDLIRRKAKSKSKTLLCSKRICRFHYLLKARDKIHQHFSSSCLRAAFTNKKIDFLLWQYLWITKKAWILKESATIQGTPLNWDIFDNFSGYKVTANVN